MLTMLRMSTAGVVGLLAVIALEWTHPAYLKLGGMVATGFAAVACLVMWRTRTRVTKHLRIPPNPLREVWLGTVFGGGWVAAMALYFAIVWRVPALSATFLDSGREATAMVLGRLTAGNNWRAAAEEALRALDEPHTPQWTRELAEQCVKYLTRAAVAGTPDAVDLLNQAISIAKKFGMDDDYPQSVLRRLAQQDATDELRQQTAEAQAKLEAMAAGNQELAKQLDQREVKYHAQFEQVRTAAAGQLAAAVNQEKTQGDIRYQQLFVRWIEDHLKLRQDAVEIALEPDGQLPRLRPLLARDIDAATQKGVNVDAAREFLARLDRELAQRMPQPLPAGCTARVLRIHPAPLPGLLLVDLVVTDPTGKPYLGLVQRDVIARQGKSRLPLHIDPVSQAGQLYLAVVLDISGSMKGTRLLSMQPAAVGMLQGLPAGTLVRATAFNDRIKLLADWSNNPAAAIAACRHLQADGGTALFSATDEAIQAFSLNPEPSERVLTVFSDGASTIPGPSKERLIAAAKRRRVTVHFIALKQAQEDTSAIEAIAAGTGGRTLFASHASELVGKFRALADELNQRAYRLAVLNRDAKQPTEITIGGENSIQLSVPPSASAAALAHRDIP